VSASWPIVRLGDVVRHRKEFLRIDDSRQYMRCRVQLHAKGVVLRDIVAGAEVKTKTQQVCRAGEFLVAEIDAKVGGFGIVPGDLDGAIVSSHYFLFVVDEPRLDRGFLDYFICTAAFREQVGARGSTNYAAIRPAHVLGYQMPLPPLAEQRRIVAKIDQLAAKIAEARGLQQQAADDAQALFVSVERQTLGDAGHTRWPPRPLESVCSVFIDCDHRTPDYVEQGIPLLRPRDVRRGFLDLSGTVRIERHEHERRCVRHRPAAGDIVYSRELSYGNAGSVPPDAELSLGQGTMLMRANPVQVLQPFLLRVLNSPAIRDQANRAAQGAAHPHVNLKDIRCFSVPTPSLAQQRRIVADLDDLQAKVDRLKALQTQTAAELAALLPAILDKTFKGTL
jgi:type I restriction enzyme S subunit